MLYYFKKGKSTTEMQKKMMCAVYREGAVTDRTCQMWFTEFHGTIDILILAQVILCSWAVLCIGRCLAAPLTSTH